MTLRSFERRVRWLAGSPRLYSKSQSCGICSGGYAEPHHHAASVHLETARNRKRGDFDIAWFYITIDTQDLHKGSISCWEAASFTFWNSMEGSKSYS